MADGCGSSPERDEYQEIACLSPQKVTMPRMLYVDDDECDKEVLSQIKEGVPNEDKMLTRPRRLA
jgi:hypothetical protein